VFVLAVGGDAAYIYHRNHAAAPTTKFVPTDPDELVFLKNEHPSSLKDEKDLKGRDLWVSAGGQLNYYPYNGHTAEYLHPVGTLLGAQQIQVKDAFEQVAPASPSVVLRIPRGDKQVLLAFTLPGDPKEYAVPVGDIEGGDYALSTDAIFFYQDPHQLYSYWGPQVWQAIDQHRATLGMTEREVQMALGQVSSPGDGEIGDRTVVYDDQGHPKTVVFSHNKATSIKDS
jgi:hypothetical protein